MSKLFTNRMFNCVFSSQIDGSEAGQYGSPVSPYPQEAKVSWFKVPFLSLDPLSSEFLVPDWNDPQVKAYIKNQGWVEGGILNTDKLITDLGAKTSAEAPLQTASIRPDKAAIIYNDKAYLNFSLQSSCNLSGLKVLSFCFIDKTQAVGTPIADSIVFNLSPALLNILPEKNVHRKVFSRDNRPEWTNS